MVLYANKLNPKRTKVTDIKYLFLLRLKKNAKAVVSKKTERLACKTKRDVKRVQGLTAIRKAERRAIFFFFV